MIQVDLTAILPNRQIVRTITLTHPVMIGSAADAGFQIPARGIAPMHAVLRANGATGGAMLMSLGREKIEHRGRIIDGALQISAYDCVRLGEVTLYIAVMIGDGHHTPVLSNSNDELPTYTAEHLVTPQGMTPHLPPDAVDQTLRSDRSLLLEPTPVILTDPIGDALPETIRIRPPVPASPSAPTQRSEVDPRQDAARPKVRPVGPIVQSAPHPAIHRVDLVNEPDIFDDINQAWTGARKRPRREVTPSAHFPIADIDPADHAPAADAARYARRTRTDATPLEPGDAPAPVPAHRQTWSEPAPVARQGTLVEAEPIKPLIQGRSAHSGTTRSQPPPPPPPPPASMSKARPGRIGLRQRLRDLLAKYLGISIVLHLLVMLFARAADQPPPRTIQTWDRPWVRVIFQPPTTPQKVEFEPPVPTVELRPLTRRRRQRPRPRPTPTPEIAPASAPSAAPQSVAKVVRHNKDARKPGPVRLHQKGGESKPRRLRTMGLQATPGKGHSGPLLGRGKARGFKAGDGTLGKGIASIGSMSDDAVDLGGIGALGPSGMGIKADMPLPKIVKTNRKTEDADTAAVRAYIAKRRRYIRFCYEDAQRSDDRLKGTLRVRFQIFPDGGIKNLTMQFSPKPSDGPRPNAEFHQCIRQEIKRWRFPKRADVYPINYPFKLRPPS